MARLGGGLLILKHGVSFCLKNEPESILNSRRVVLRFGLNQRLLFDRKDAVERDLVAGHCAHEKPIELAGLAGLAGWLAYLCWLGCLRRVGWLAAESLTLESEIPGAS